MANRCGRAASRRWRSNRHDESNRPRRTYISDMDTNNDPQLIALLDRIAAREHGSSQADSEAALRELYDLTSSRLYGLAVRVVTNREWAEDVLQEAYLNIWRIAGNYRAALSPPLAWMGVVVRSRALRTHRLCGQPQCRSGGRLSLYRSPRPGSRPSRQLRYRGGAAVRSPHHAAPGREQSL